MHCIVKNIILKYFFKEMQLVAFFIFHMGKTRMQVKNDLRCLRQKIIMRAFVVFSNGKNGTIGRQIPFKVLPMVPLVMPLVPMVPMLPTYGSKGCRQNTAWVILPTRQKSRDSIWRA